ncbi:MAG: glycosyltransferase [Pseudomonas sp.]|uniref:glycosyltransferase n=1 Tax=Pseudomonas sp. TaxID=306 RepID=UPI003393A9C5
MKILVYSEINATTIEASLGLPEYSYYFVLREFLPVLEPLGEVIVVTDPGREVDVIYREALARGEGCLFLSFSPPHRTPLDLECPTVPVFAWEFDSIPTQSWYDRPEHDWRHGLARCGRAIVHSTFTAQTVRDALGADFPVVSVPAPVWDKFQAVRKAASLPREARYELNIARGVLFDTRDLSLEPWMPGPDAVAAAVAAARGQVPVSDSPSPEQAPEPLPVAPSLPSATAPRVSALRITLRYLAEWYRLVWRDSLPTPLTSLINRLRPSRPAVVAPLPEVSPWEPAPRHLTLEGVVFTAVFNPYDGRKNWVDMLTAFCSAFRDTADATLVFKLGHHEYREAIEGMLMGLARLPAFRCRVVILHGYLDKMAYQNLIQATHFVVNASHGEGQCLPLMEYLSCGKPAVAPRHSAMSDYIDGDVAFVVDTWLDATAWPHDPRLAYRTCRHQIDWTSLVQAYSRAYHCAVQEPERYRQMSVTAIERLQRHCSQQVARERLLHFLNLDETPGP